MAFRLSKRQWDEEIDNIKAHADELAVKNPEGAQAKSNF